MTTIIIHQLELSPFCEKVRRVLHYKGLPFTVKNLPIGELAKLKKMSPVGKVPVMEIDGEIIADSSDICRELEARFPEKPIFPTQPEALALANILEDWADESLYFFELTMRFIWPYDKDHWLTEMLKRDNKLIQFIGRFLIFSSTKKQGLSQGLAKRSEGEILQELERHIQSLDAILDGRDYLVGEQLSLADIAVLSQLNCVAGSCKGLELIQRAKNIPTWVDRVATLPGGKAAA